ncbi:MAG: DUF1559 domain-containing protein [Planctomycetaceae bacterium]|nr:DUF1559 domain-containing protein [Planctomycetaceae bacterium]
MTDQQRPFTTFYAFCSLIIPGLGQLFQKRAGTALGFFVVFLLSGFLPMFILTHLFMDRFSFQPMRVHVIHLLVFGGVCIPLMLTYFYAVLDASRIPIKKPKEKPELEPEKKQKVPRCFTLVDFLVIVAIMGILIALLLPAVPAAREAAKRMQRMQCTNNMKEIVFAFHNYHDVYGCLPPVYTVDEGGKPLHSWRVLILPFIEQKALYEKIRLDEPWDSEHNQQFHEAVPDTFRCPSNPHHKSGNHSPAETAPYMPTLCGSTYSVIYGAKAAFTGSQPTCFADITNGKSNVIVLVERRTPVNWMNPLSDITFEAACKGVNADAMGISSYHSGGTNAGLGDGSCRFISDTIDGETLRKMLMRNNKEPEM